MKLWLECFVRTMWLADEACCMLFRMQLLRHGDRVLHELAGIRRDGHPHGELPMDAYARLDPYPGERGDETSARGVSTFAIATMYLFTI